MTELGFSGRVHVDKRKYPDVLRATFEACPLGTDRWGEWLSVPAVQAVLLLPVSEWWVAWFRADGSLKIDIAADVRAGGGQRSFVDLDLDIERGPEGIVRILDEDQFAERCPAYPQPWVSAARHALTETADRARRREEPFGQAHHPWSTRAYPPSAIAS